MGFDFAEVSADACSAAGVEGVGNGFEGFTVDLVSVGGKAAYDP
jgi:hypothetical protein